MVSCFVRWLFCFFKYWLTSLCACAVLSAWNGRWRSLCSFFIQKFFKLKYIPESEMFFLFAFPCWSAGGLEGLLYKKTPPKNPPPKNHATLKDTHKMYLTNTGNTKGRGNCLKKYIKIQIIKKKKYTGSCYSYHPVSQWMCLWYKFENPRRLSSRVITFQDFSENFWPGCWNNWDSNYHINKLGRPCCAPACCCDENTPSAFYRWGVTMVANLKIFVV